MSEFTKGPYKAEKEVVIDGYGEILTVFVRGSIKGRNNEDCATARLLAAAPDMLEALEELVEQLEGEYFCFKKAREAIAKAKGEIK